MTITGQDLRLATIDAAASWRDLLRQSRPATWGWTALPYLAGSLDAERGLSAAVVLGTLYFLGPFNLLRHGVGEVVGRGSRPKAAALPMLIAIAVTNVPLLIALAYLGGPPGTLALAVTAWVGIVEGVPELRARWWPESWPLLDALSLVFPAMCGLLIGGRAFGELPWAILAAFWLWAAASLALSAMARHRSDDADLRTTRTRAPRIDRRATAVLALAAYAVAVALLARHGTLGLLAAIGVALYLALPLSVLLAGRSPGAMDAALRRALWDRAGLDVLVGAWVALLLLRHWGLMAYSPWLAAIVVPSALTAYVLGSIVATRIATRRRAVRQTDADAPAPSVTIVVPCHDDADRLSACLAAIRSQTYADTTVLVVDAGSTDGSPEEAAAWLGADMVLIAPPCPDGWKPRDWARHVGATAAGTELVLFVDADTVLAPVATRILVEQQQANRADLLSGLTRFEMRTVGERAAVPGVPLVLFGLVPVWWSALTAGRPAQLAFATTSFLLVRRDAYLAAVAPSGPAAIGAPGDRMDLRLARAFAHARLAVRTVHAVDLGATRHHRNVEEALAAWRRNIVPPTYGGLALAVAAMLVEVVAFLVPLALPAVALLTDQPPQLIAAASIPLVLLVVARIALVIEQRHAPSTILWHPVTVILALVGQVAGIADHIVGRTERSRDHEVSRPGSAAVGTGG